MDFPQSLPHSVLCVPTPCPCRDTCPPYPSAAWHGLLPPPLPVTWIQPGLLRAWRRRLQLSPLCLFMYFVFSFLHPSPLCSSQVTWFPMRFATFSVSRFCASFPILGKPSPRPEPQNLLDLQSFAVTSPPRAAPSCIPSAAFPFCARPENMHFYFNLCYMVWVCDLLKKLSFSSPYVSSLRQRLQYSHLCAPNDWHRVSAQ